MMKKIFLILIIGILLINFISSSECYLSFNINYQLKATQEGNSLELSKYQSPNFKQDDFLHFWKIYITNEANCTSEEMILKMNITDPEGNVWDHLFCNYYLIIPPLDPSETYYIIPKGIETRELGNFSYKTFYYQDSKGKNLTFCNPSMRNSGLWNIKLSLEPSVLNPNKFVSQLGYTMLDDKDRLIDNSFRVRDKSAIINEELQRKGLIFTIVFTFLGIALGYFLSEFKDWRRDLKTKKGSIKALIHELEQNLTFVRYLQENKEIFTKKNKVPFHNLILLNLEKAISGDYINNLKLTDKLFDYYQSSLIINNFLIRMRSISVPKDITDMNKIFETLPNYILGLERLIKKLEGFNFLKNKIFNLERIR